MELRLDRISKTYGGGKAALHDVSATLGAGVTGVVGPNGSGKSTLLRILATTSRPTSGRLLFEGDDVAQRPERYRRALAYMPQNFGAYERLRANEFLEYVARLRGTPGREAARAADAALEAVGLTADARRELRTYTPGMMQRLGLATVLQTRAAVVVLDEPTAGLDPAARATLENALAERARTSAVIVCTHILPDLERIADRIIALRDGRLQLDAKRDDLLALAREHAVEPRLEEACAWLAASGTRA